MKRFWNLLSANWDAARDATREVDGRERFLLEHLGPEPVAFDPAGNEEHAQVARDLALEPEIRELEDDERRAENLVPSLGTPTASRRLARLVGAGLLKIRVLDLNRPNLYVLTRRSFDLLVAQGSDPDALHLGVVRRGEGLDHLAQINDVRVILELESHGAPGVAVRAFLADHDLRRAAGANPRAYIPDALVEIDRPLPAPSIGLAVEVDLGTEAPSVLAAKATQTLTLASSRAALWGVSRWRVTFIAPSEKRLRSVARAVTEAGAGAFWFGSDWEQIRRSGFLGRSWLSLQAVAEAEATTALPYSRSIVGEGAAR